MRREVPHALNAGPRGQSKLRPPEHRGPRQRLHAVLSSGTTRLWASEVAIIAVAFFSYFLVRGLTEGSEARALTNADRIVNVEKTLGIFVEPDWQSAIDGSQWMIDLANWVYMYGHWPVILVAAIWLLWRRPAAYRITRNAFLISGGIGLVIFALFPTAPPRLAGLNVIDTVTEHSNAYRVLQPPALVNQYAAVPSLHFGWNLLIGIVLVRQSTNIFVRGFGMLMPTLMFLAVILTANHFIFDAAAGAAVALTGLAISLWLASRSKPKDSPPPPATGEAASP